MKKEDAVERLKENGYKAFIREGLPTAVVTVNEYNHGAYRKIKNLLHEIGYEGSWCVTLVRGKNEKAEH